MEYGTIERELHIDAAPDVVFEVVSSPEHIKDWWNAETDVEPVAGSVGELVWRDETSSRAETVPITIVAAEPPRLFSFRWVYSAEETAGPGNSLLVTFELTPSGTGTTLRLTESGFRERGWEAAVLEASYNDHVAGWDSFVPRIAQRALELVATR
jgi:uncharacterized protein YndB with AHSA1/START domain